MNKMQQGRSGEPGQWSLGLLASLLIAWLACGQPVSAADTVKLTITGTLYAPPCQLADENLAVTLKEISTTQLELGPTPPIQFTVGLKNCDMTRVKSAKVAIKGSAPAGMAGMLALDAANSEAKGFAIGFKQGMNMATDLALGAESSEQVVDDARRLYFGAYAKKLPQATLVPGNFMATATLQVTYP